MPDSGLHYLGLIDTDNAMLSTHFLFSQAFLNQARKTKTK